MISAERVQTLIDTFSDEPLVVRQIAASVRLPNLELDEDLC